MELCKQARVIRFHSERMMLVYLHMSHKEMLGFVLAGETPWLHPRWQQPCSSFLSRIQKVIQYTWTSIGISIQIIGICVQIMEHVRFLHLKPWTWYYCTLLSPLQIPINPQIYVRRMSTTLGDQECNSNACWAWIEGFNPLSLQVVRLLSTLSRSGLYVQEVPSETLNPNVYEEWVRHWYTRSSCSSNCSYRIWITRIECIFFSLPFVRFLSEVDNISRGHKWTLNPYQYHVEWVLHWSTRDCQFIRNSSCSSNCSSRPWITRIKSLGLFNLCGSYPLRYEVDTIARSKPWILLVGIFVQLLVLLSSIFIGILSLYHETVFETN